MGCGLRYFEESPWEAFRYAMPWSRSQCISGIIIGLEWDLWWYFSMVDSVEYSSILPLESRCKLSGVEWEDFGASSVDSRLQHILMD